MAINGLMAYFNSIDVNTLTNLYLHKLSSLPSPLQTEKPLIILVALLCTFVLGNFPHNILLR